jgi:YkoY family integral membrane protein
MWGIHFSDFPLIMGTILTLVFLEGLLSADNALVLAVMVRHLPREQQKRALRFGIWGAFGFRLIAVLLSAVLLQFWLFKVVGGAYLLYLAGAQLFSKEEDVHANKTTRFGSGFWGTVASVELADIAFSIDSILAAVAMAGGLPKELGGRALFGFPMIGLTVTMELAIVYIGGILGIIAMRFVAGYFLVLLEKFAGLATGAYYLVGWIGVKLVGSGFHNALHPPFDTVAPAWHDRVPEWAFKVPLEMSEWVFWGGMGLIVVISMLYKPKTPPPEPILTESEFRA